jgi:ubiquinone/menaquinone biosynthesis C-methylase UbiE
MVNPRADLPSQCGGINAQYNYARSDSLAVRISTSVRRKMFAKFMAEITPTEAETVLDLGVTSDRSYSCSNYFEELYPYKHRITAAGIDDAKFLEELYPGVKFEFADALNLPYPDRAFDIVHSSAVWEHIGSLDNQSKMLSECLRVARRAAFLTTPNRWHPAEFHTQLPFLHWLPKPIFRNILKRIGRGELADEANLNLLTPSEVKRLIKRYETRWDFCLASAYFPGSDKFGWPSNILLIARRHGT